MSESSENIPEHYEIVRATSEDTEQIRQLTHDSWIKTISDTLLVPAERLEEHLEAMMTDEALKQWRESLAHPPEGYTTLVAKAGAKVFGVCTVRQHANDKGENELVAIHVLAGKTESGIGGKLWRMAEHALDPKKNTFLWTTPGTDAAEKMYPRWGFEPVEYTEEQLQTKVPLSRPKVKMVKKSEIVAE